MRVENPFPKTLRETRVCPENRAILNELGAYLTSVALVKKRMPVDQYGNKYRADKTRDYTDKA